MKHTIAISLLLMAWLSPLWAQTSLKDIFVSQEIAELRTYVSKKSDPNRAEGGYYPIVVAAKIGDAQTVRDLIAQGADINARGHKKRTALMYAAEQNHLEVGEILLENRAQLIIMDQSGKTAMDFAKDAGSQAFANLIREHLPKYAGADGPHIIANEKGYEVLHVLPGKGGHAVQSQQLSESELLETPLQCYDRDGSPLFEVQINRPPQIYPGEYDGLQPIFALSDIEGNFGALRDLLIAGNVMDKSYNWIFDKGHLVLTGDFFDRGDQVTECLWLIYKLEQQALEAGGRVHFLLGNHELMNLYGDLRFVRMKYKVNARMMGKSYNDLYGEDSILGRWLRTKPAMLRINDILFTHAGLSPEFMRGEFPISSVNESVMVSGDQRPKGLSGAAAHVLAKSGPLWCRDIPRGRVSEEQLQSMLEFYSTSTIIFGHSRVDDIEATYGGMAINLDVHHASGPEHQKALYIHSGNFESVDVKGRRKAIK